MKRHHTQKILALTTALVGASACTGQLPNSFRLQNQQQTFDTQLEVNTKIDLLWVVDNSSSMDVAQEKLREGFASFATKYLQPTWDIRVAVITTDTYLANPAFSNYLGRAVKGAGTSSAYINSRLGTWSNNVNTITKPLVNLSTGKFDSGVKLNDLVPAWGPQYAKLLPGYHDGPIAALCIEEMPYFKNGPTQCAIRDNQNAYNGPSHCLNPGSGENGVSQCVNTVQNDSIHSGKAIISTMPANEADATASWTQQLINDFTVNVSTGSAGLGSERGMGSVLQLLSDNESTETAFFRKGSLRGIIFVSDEEDQTMTIESNPPASFTAWSHYKCDQAGLIAMNGAGPVSTYCCSGGSCSYGAEGTSCPSKTVDNHTYTPSLCANPAYVMPVETVKTQLDTFFRNLEGSEDAAPNYFVTAIVPLTGDSIQQLQAARANDDTSAGAIKTISTDRGDRYIELANQVGNGSMSMNIADSDYSPILDAIGRTLVEKQGTFPLERAPTGAEEVMVRVKHLDGSMDRIDPAYLTVVEKSIVVHDLNTILRLKASDKIVINYQPKTVF